MQVKKERRVGKRPPWAGLRMTFSPGAVMAKHWFRITCFAGVAAI